MTAMNYEEKPCLHCAMAAAGDRFLSEQKIELTPMIVGEVIDAALNVAADYLVAGVPENVQPLVIKKAHAKFNHHIAAGKLIVASLDAEPN